MFIAPKQNTARNFYFLPAVNVKSRSKDQYKKKAHMLCGLSLLKRKQII